MNTGTEHVSLDNGPHPDQWVEGATCDDCQQYIAERYLELQTSAPVTHGPVATGRSSLSPKVDKFLATGDPSIFAKPGALDYQGDE